MNDHLTCQIGTIDTSVFIILCRTFHEPLLLNYDRHAEVDQFIQSALSGVQRGRLQSVLKLIEGFESTYALELLASVDYASKQPGVNHVEQVIDVIKQWNPRKANLFQPDHVKLAYTHLETFKSGVFS